MVLINKADLEGGTAAKKTLADYQSALRLLHGNNPPPVFAVSALKGEGLDEVTKTLTDRQKDLLESGRLQEIRRQQQVKWLKTLIEKNVLIETYQNPALQKLITRLEAKILDGRLSPLDAAEEFRLEFRR